ncbi:MAG: hypothetical protein K9I47_10760 [Bacteroidales bacterium]|nr:hypothetical protein [Bacteroidales bacterium]
MGVKVEPQLGEHGHEWQEMQEVHRFKPEVLIGQRFDVKPQRRAMKQDKRRGGVDEERVGESLRAVVELNEAKRKIHGIQQKKASQDMIGQALLLLRKKQRRQKQRLKKTDDEYGFHGFGVLLFWAIKIGKTKKTCR